MGYCLKTQDNRIEKNSGVLIQHSNSVLIQHSNITSEEIRFKRLNDHLRIHHHKAVFMWQKLSQTNSGPNLSSISYLWLKYNFLKFNIIHKGGKKSPFPYACQNLNTNYM